jgi:valyl-tRNA synthetase
LSQTAEVHPIRCELDRAFAAKLQALVVRATASFEDFNHAQALTDTESFFWTHFTDSYLELAKARARGDGSQAECGSAVAALRLGLSVMLRLFAPFLPYICEEAWSWSFAEETGHASIHRAPWPGSDDFAGIDAPDSEASFDIAVACWNAINKSKADAEVSMGREVEGLSIAASAQTLAALEPVLADVLAATRARSHRLVPGEDGEDNPFRVFDAVFAPKPA